ncbi:hypothetical protein BVRB_3g058340 [Beta vulgaris subsp. vulgaris]|nr:hypothetical protein BVRB_3g058340 [Beta vulgaris subsp. vulgaris]
MTRTCFGDLGDVRSCWGYKLKLVRSEQETKDTHLNNVRLFSLKELKKATNNFGANAVLGRGGFSSYYKGTLENGTVVAVVVPTVGNADQKCVSNSPDLVDMLSRIRHRNVVEFIGCCLDGSRRIMVYEFAGDNNLDQLLFLGNSEAKRSELNWSRRASICIGIARGLEYLHEGITHRVVHRDIKPSNVVLDSNFNPKIVDFGIAQLSDHDVSHHSCSIAGTLGYLDPEYILTARLTEKADVYSFGIILLEVISGRKVREFQNKGSEATLVSWVWELRETDRVLEIVDPTLYDFPEDDVKRFIDVALSCVQSSSKLRPSMSEALLMLLGPYDFSKKVLKNPEHSIWSGDHDEVHFSSHDEESGKAEITVASSDAPSSVHASGTKHFPDARNRYGTAPSQPAIEPISKSAHGFETEIESDLDTYSSASELVEISHDLETELSRTIEANISAAASASKQSGKSAVKPELISSSLGTRTGYLSSLNTDSDVHEEAISEPQMSKPSLSDNKKTTSSAEIDISVQNEAVGNISFDIQNNGIDEILSLPEVDVKTPIQRTVEKILEGLKDSHRRSICLYGRGGSGKTTVLKNLFLHPAAKELFDQILYVTVPRFGYQKHVRDEIIQQLSLNVQDSCTDKEIIFLIHQALVDRKFLVLLDDDWGSIDLPEVGFPSPGPESSCWFVLATRSLDACPILADMEIEMEVLSNVEASQLFFSKVGDIIDSLEIKPYAQAISNECYGSPVILSAMGSALRAESNVAEWKLALEKLQFGNTANTSAELFFSRHIKFCYDRLRARDVKTCFLYTALFQEEKEIDNSTLVECFISEGLVGGRTPVAYRKGHDIVGHLVRASLIEANDNGLKVKMHYIVRDSALEIFSSDIEGFRVLSRLPEIEKDDGQSSQTKLVDKTNTFDIQLPGNHKYLTRAGAHLKEPPSMEEWEQATMMFLMDNEISSLPRKPNCSTLVALLLQRNSCLRVIPASFFDSMLRSLQILLLRDCERLLVLPPSIGNLKSLEVLDLQGTEVTHLPDNVGVLTSLKQLRVSFYGSMDHREYNKLPAKLVSDGIISSLRLRELGMFVYPGDRRWTLSASDITKEISILKLSVLYFHFPEVEHLEYFVHGSQSWKDRDVTTFNLVVGHDFKRIVSLVSIDTELLYNEGQRCLRFVNGENIPEAVAQVLTRATSFYLDHHLNICYLSQFGNECFDSLNCCILRDCPELVGIVNSLEHGSKFLPVLEYLSINYMWKLERIWVGHPAMGSLAMLRCLTLHACPKLCYVLTCSMLDILPNLEELVIEDCVSLKYVVSKNEDVEEIMHDDEACMSSVSVVENLKPKQTIARDVSALRNLKVLKLHYLPEMCGIWKGQWPQLEYISFYNCPKLKNLYMEGNDGVHVKEIAADKAWWDSLEWTDLVLYRRLHKLVNQIHIDGL